MFKHLLVPVDGSDVSKKSLKKVAELAKADGAAVTLVYVSDPLPPMVYSWGLTASRPPAQGKRLKANG